MEQKFPVELFRADLGTLSCPNKPAMDKALTLGFEVPYAHQEFPKTMYGPNGKSKVVASLEEESALGEGWSSTPVKGQHFNIQVDEPLKAVGGPVLVQPVEPVATESVPEDAA